MKGANETFWADFLTVSEVSLNLQILVFSVSVWNLILEDLCTLKNCMTLCFINHFQQVWWLPMFCYIAIRIPTHKLTGLGMITAKKTSQNPWSEGAKVMENKGASSKSAVKLVCHINLDVKPDVGKRSASQSSQTWTVRFVGLKVYESYNSMQR